MQKLKITGGKRISGTVLISGSKNATLPILASTILNDKKLVLGNIPIVRDVETMVNLLSTMGSTIELDKKAKKMQSMVTDYLTPRKKTKKILNNFNNLPGISQEHEEQPIILDGFESEINCKLALDVCQISVMADTLGIPEKEITGLIAEAIENPKDQIIISNEN